VRDWPYSSFHKYVERGYYAIDWGDDVNVDDGAQFGE
jgi:putative transposase